jgi:hypothetical protein
MAKTFTQIQTALAYRLGEDSAVSNANEKARRKEFILQAYRDIVNRRPWWWTETSDSFDSIADQQVYTTVEGFPSDFREPIKLRVDGVVYTYIPESKIFGLYDSTVSIFNYDNIITSKHYYVFNNSLYFYPATPSTGTNNIELKYYKYPTDPSADADTFIIPDQYSHALDAFAYGRISQIDGMRGDASDGFAEFEEVIKEMNVEHNRRRLYGKAIRMVEPDYLVD